MKIIINESDTMKISKDDSKLSLYPKNILF